MKQFLFAVSAIFYFSSISLAEIPHTISYQGILTDAQGDAVPNGDFNVTFSIYDDSLSGNLLWSEQQAIHTSDGIFNVNLGVVSSIPDSAFQSRAYIGFQIEGQAEMTPRVALQSVPYSYQSKKSQFAVDADMVDGLEGASLEESQEIANTVNQHTNDFGHLTPPQLQDLTSGGFTTLHNHSIVGPEHIFRTATYVQDSWTNAFTVPADKIRYITNVSPAPSQAGYVEIKISAETVLKVTLGWGTTQWTSGGAPIVVDPTQSLDMITDLFSGIWVYVTGYEFDYVPPGR
jgi:hypothetical protein